ncbi:hypothetical protein Sjap_001934 [Stephania japonica]|uniref:Uncharacterized protein n=1 Tax=Stephania japonica TaxID=461633 RepID=A0AAP0KN74_9MAGN
MLRRQANERPNREEYVRTQITDYSLEKKYEETENAESRLDRTKNRDEDLERDFKGFKLRVFRGVLIIQPIPANFDDTLAGAFDFRAKRWLHSGRCEAGNVGTFEEKDHHLARVRISFLGLITIMEPIIDLNEPMGVKSAEVVRSVEAMGSAEPIGSAEAGRSAEAMGSAKAMGPAEVVESIKAMRPIEDSGHAVSDIEDNDDVINSPGGHNA